MKQKTSKKLNQLNNDFYTNIATSFDKTRSNPWLGWEKLWKKSLHNKQINRVLDVGCGNGRFGVFIREQKLDVKYIGVDKNAGLLGKAKKNLGEEVELIRKDILTDPWEKNLGKFDLVVMMAVWHHVPGKKLRKELAKKLVGFLDERGILVWSFWQFEQDDRLQKKLIDGRSAVNEYGVGFDKNDLEEGDWFLSWQSSGKLRYCHSYSSSEIKELIEFTGLNLNCEFEADGKSNKLNKYVVLSKNLK